MLWLLVLLSPIWSFCEANHPVLLVVLDGFRHDYLSTHATPNLDRILSGGVLVPFLEPEFPAAKQPFLVSLLTGVHSADHGIFANQIFWESAERVETLDENDVWSTVNNLSTLWDLEPKFCTCNWPHAQHLVTSQQQQRQNVIMTSEIKEDLNSNVTNDKVAETTTPLPPTKTSQESFLAKCIDAIIPRLMDESGNQARFASVFVGEPGETAMTFGPDSPELTSAMERLDDAIGQLLDRLEEMELWPQRLNLIVTSSPGYAELSPTHLIELSSLVDSSLYQPVGESPVLNIRPLKKELFVYEELRKGEKTSPFKVYIKEEFPKEHHYASNENVQELIVVAEEGFAFSFDMRDRMKELDDQANRTNLALKNLYGLSGYNNSLPSMQTMVIAQGPDLATGGKMISPDDKMRVVDLFALLCNLLEVKYPSHAVGDMDRVRNLLRYPSDTQVVKVIRGWMSMALMPQNLPITITLGVTALTFLLVLFILILRWCCCPRRKALDTTHYRYTQVKTNRRMLADNQDHDDTDDKQRLLTEVPINDDEEEAL